MQKVMARILHPRFPIIGIVFLFLVFYAMNKTMRKSSGGPIILPGEPYDYEMIEPVPHGIQDEVDLRVLVFVYDRVYSVMKCLEALQDLELDGDRAVIDVFLDRGEDGKIHEPTLKAVSGFSWKKGPVRVHQQKQHVGIGGQWIDTWQPRSNSSEIAIILEDDIDLSMYAYRWLKAAYVKYGRLSHVGGFSLHEGTIPGMRQLPGDLTFLHPNFGTHAFAPLAEHWCDFRQWYHKRRKNPFFHPYVDANPITTAWFKDFEKSSRHESMWEQWYIRFTYDNELFTVYPNLQHHSYVHAIDMTPRDTYLAYHRAEPGLHFAKEGRSSEGHLIGQWDERFLNFPTDIKRYFYNGKNALYLDKH